MEAKGIEYRLGKYGDELLVARCLIFYNSSICIFIYKKKDNLICYSSFFYKLRTIVKEDRATEILNVKVLQVKSTYLLYIYKGYGEPLKNY